VSEVLVPEKKHLKTLERRIAHLEGRLDERRERQGMVSGSATFEASELAALRVAVSLVRQYRGELADEGGSYTTPFLLEEAAAALESAQSLGGHVLPARTLVKELRERARLLEELA